MHILVWSPATAARSARMTFRRQVCQISLYSLSGKII
jgi:hypothetical protein